MGGLVISSGVVLSPTDAVALAHPRILWNDLLPAATLVASSEAEGFEAVNVSSGLTWDKFVPEEMPATLTWTFASAKAFDSLLLARHTLGSSQTTILFEVHDGTDWATVFELMLGNDSVAWFAFDEQFSNRARLTLTGEAIPAIAVAMLGKAMRLQRGVTLNHAPLAMQRKTVARPNISNGGQTLGRSIRRTGVAGKIDVENLTTDFVRAELDPFILSARTKPFGWLWSPVSYPAEAAFLWLPGDKPDISPMHAGLPDRMNVGFEVEGITDA